MYIMMQRFVIEPDQVNRFVPGSGQHKINEQVLFNRLFYISSFLMYDFRRYYYEVDLLHEMGKGFFDAIMSRGKKT